MINIATIGSGVIVDRMIDAIAQVNGVNLYAVYSRTEEKANAFAAKHKADKAYWDLDEMLQDPAVDVVYVASPNSLHFSQAKRALAAGKHVLLEKPFCATKEQAEELFALAEQHGVFLMEAITNVHTPNFKAVQAHLPAIGNVKLVQCNFSQYSSRYDKYKNRQVTNAFDLKFEGGALMDINVYNLHFMVGLFGCPDSLHYFMNIGYNGIDTSGVLVLEYPEFVAVCTGAKDSSSPYSVYIQGDEGTIRVDRASSGVCEHVDLLLPKGDSIGKTERGETTKEIGIDQGFHMFYELSDFEAMIRRRDTQSYEANKAQTLKVMVLLDEAKRQRNLRFDTKEEL